MLMRSIALILTIAAVALIAVGCGDDSDDGEDGGGGAAATQTTEEATTEAATTEAAAPEAKGTVVKVSDSEFGRILFGSNDQAIYLFEKESGPKSECYDECAEAWPPVLTKGDPVAGEGTDQSLLGTTQRDDGSTQVTYNGHPLYFYANEGPGEVRCHNVDLNGGIWAVVQPNGDRAA
jgi:predicted lipoprotein with Yx(FWY)xxD motif